MMKHILAAVVASGLIAAPLAPALAQAATEKTDAKKATKTTAAKKELTPQQQKMKDCSAKWGDYKKAKKVSGKTEHNKFMSTCLKG
jgi:hypothetical protein